MRRNQQRADGGGMAARMVLVLVVLMAMVVGVGPTVGNAQNAAQNADECRIPEASPETLAECFPASTLVYIEAPDFARVMAITEPPIPPDNVAAQLRRADVTAYRRESAAALGKAFGLTEAETDKLHAGSGAMAVGVLDAGQDFGHLLIVVRHAHVRDVMTAMARLKRQQPAAVETWTTAGHSGFTVTMPDKLDALTDRLPMELAGPMATQDPYKMLLSMTGDKLSVAGRGNVLLVSNHRAGLQSALSRLAGESDEASLHRLDSFEKYVTSAQTGSSVFLFVEMRNILDFLDRTLSERGRRNLDDANTWAHLQRIIGVVGVGNVAPTGAGVLLQIMFDAHPTFEQLRMEPRPLALLDSLPEFVLGGFALAIPNPADALNRVLDFIRQMLPQHERELFEQELANLEGELGLPGLPDLVTPLGDEAAYVYLDPDALPTIPAEDDSPRRFRDAEGNGFVFAIKDPQEFDDRWKRFAESPQLAQSLRLTDGTYKEIHGIAAYVAGGYGGVCWARTDKLFFLAADEPTLTALIQAGLREPKSAGTLGHSAGFRRLRESFPATLSKFVFSDLGRAVNAGAFLDNPAIEALTRDAWIGLSFEERDSLAIRLELNVLDFPDRLEAAIYAGIEETRVRGCMENLRVLGEAIRDYRLDRGEFPASTDDLVRANKFSYAKNGASPLEIAAAKRAGKPAEEIAGIRSYALLRPAFPEKLDENADDPWGPPINSLMIGYTVRPILHGGRHVLMSNGTVHWVTAEHFEALKRQAEQGLTQAQLDEEWNRQAQHRQNQGNR